MKSYLSFVMINRTPAMINMTLRIATATDSPMTTLSLVEAIKR